MNNAAAKQRDPEGSEGIVSLETCAADRQHTSEGIGISYNKIITITDSEIAKNNRLALLADIYSRRSAMKKTRETEDTMAKGKTASCDGCGRDKLNLSSCSGDVVCSSCAAMYGAINNRLPTLAAAIKRLGKADELAGLLGSKAAVEVDTAAMIKAVETAERERDRYQTLADGRLMLLEEIAEAVGYAFDDRWDGLVEAVANLESDRNRLLLECPPRNLTMALGLPEDALWSVVEYAAIQTAALLEYYQVASVVQAVERSGQPQEQDWLLRLRDLLGMPVSRPGELVDAVVSKIEEGDVAISQLEAIRQSSVVTDPSSDLVADVLNKIASRDRLLEMCERFAAEKNILADRVSELETAQAVHEQVLEQIGEVVHCEGCHPGELPSRVASALVGGPLLPQPTSVTHPCPLDSHLLDLVLEFPGIPLDRIALIREAV